MWNILRVVHVQVTLLVFQFDKVKLFSRFRLNSFVIPKTKIQHFLKHKAIPQHKNQISFSSGHELISIDILKQRAHPSAQVTENFK